MLASLSLKKDPPSLQWLEFFAGNAEATKSFQKCGYKTGRLDINYMEAQVNCMNPMDLLSDAGFAFLGLILIKANVRIEWLFLACSKSPRDIHTHLIVSFPEHVSP